MKENIEYRNSQNPFKVNVVGALCSNYLNKELLNIDMHTCTKGKKTPYLLLQCHVYVYSICAII